MGLVRTRLHFISPGGGENHKRYWLGKGLIKPNCGRVILKHNVGAKSTGSGISQLRLENQLCHLLAV